MLILLICFAGSKSGTFAGQVHVIPPSTELDRRDRRSRLRLNRPKTPRGNSPFSGRFPHSKLLWAVDRCCFFACIIIHVCTTGDRFCVEATSTIQTTNQHLARTFRHSSRAKLAHTRSRCTYRRQDLNVSSPPRELNLKLAGRLWWITSFPPAYTDIEQTRE